MPKADRLSLLFGLDGTMVDTDRLHLGAWNAVLAHSGRRVDAAVVTAALFPGRPEEERAAPAAEKEAAFRSLVGRLEPTRGPPEVLAWAEAE